MGKAFLRTNRPPPESWYEIHEWIPPENALANVPVFAPVCVRRGGRLVVWQEEDEKTARAKFQSLANDRRLFRLVLVWRETVADNRG